MLTKKAYTKDVKYRCVAAYYFESVDHALVEKLKAKGLADRDIALLLERTTDRRTDRQKIAESLKYTFRPLGPYYAGRFNESHFPALYTAKGPETAECELKHYVQGLQPSNPVPFVVFSIVFTGTLCDIRGAASEGKITLHDSDYAQTQQLAADYFESADVDGIAAPSARYNQGSCCAIFRPATVEVGRVVRRGADIMTISH